MDDPFSSSVLANIATAILLVVFGAFSAIVLRLPFIYGRRRRLLRFFGLTEENPELTVYLSTLFIKSGGAANFKGEAWGFRGAAIPLYEYQLIAPLMSLFDDPLLGSFSTRSRNWLSAKVSWIFSEIRPTFVESPRDKSQLTSTCSLAIGSRYYNSAADFYTAKSNVVLTVDYGEGSARIAALKGERAGESFQSRPEKKDELALVERTLDESSGQTVFHTAGITRWGTTGALLYLTENWEQLFADFGCGDFALCLRFQDVSDDPRALEKPIELARIKK